MKQLLLDIIESQENESKDEYAFPNHPIVPTKPAFFCNGDVSIDTDDNA